MTSALDPDAAARVAWRGDIPPMRQQGSAAVRAAIDSPLRRGLGDRHGGLRRRRIHHRHKDPGRRRRTPEIPGLTYRFAGPNACNLPYRVMRFICGESAGIEADEGSPSQP
ncbi:hypothetical protein [Mycobacterium sp.]|uniref:hypothetical protein n=1 Tax=Mycobacterium sp. TaxID=1785 RepID=UPI003F9D8E97